jgi:hypothetical protein
MRIIDEDDSVSQRIRRILSDSSLLIWLGLDSPWFTEFVMDMPWK